MLPWWSVGLALIMIVNIFSLNDAAEQVVTEDSNVNIRPVSQLISFNSTGISEYLIIPEDNGICGNYEVEVDVNKDVFYENDELIIQGSAPVGAKLEARLIPLNGMTPGKMVSVPLKGSNFEYALHQYGPNDMKLEYAVLINAIKETTDGNTCLLGDYAIIQYKGSRK